MRKVLFVFSFLTLTTLSLPQAYCFPPPPELPSQRDLDFAYLTEAAGNHLKNPQSVLGAKDLAQFFRLIHGKSDSKILKALKQIHPKDLIRESVYQFKYGRISESQLSTVNYFSSAIMQFILYDTTISVRRDPITNSTLHDINITRLDFFSEDVQKKLEEIQVVDFDDPIVTEYFQLDDRTLFPFSHTKEIFLKEMERDSSIEKKALLMPVPSPDPYNWSTVYGELVRILGFLKPIEFPEGSGKYSIVIPSDTLFKTLVDLSSLNANGKGESTKIFHKFGKLNSLVTGRAAATHSWVINLQHPELGEMLTADHLFSGSYGFTLHDVYHSIRWSRISSLENALIARIKSIVLQYRKVHDPQRKDKKLSLILQLLTDGELHDSRIGDSLMRHLFGFLFPGDPTRFLFEWPPELLVDILADLGNQVVVENRVSSDEADQEMTVWTNFLKDQVSHLPSEVEALFYQITTHGEQGKKNAKVLAPIFRAGRLKNLPELAKLLLENKEDLKGIMIHEELPLLTAIGHLHGVDALRVALRVLVEPEFLEQRYTKDLNEATLLMGEIYFGRCELADEFEKGGADLFQVDSLGYSVLHYAARQKDSRCLKNLLKSGKFTSEMINGKFWEAKGDLTPLKIAVKLGNTKNVKLLLKYGAKIDTTDRKLF